MHGDIDGIELSTVGLFILIILQCYESGFYWRILTTFFGIGLNLIEMIF